MLGKLVNKFKRQTLQDGIVVGGSSSPSQHSPPPIRETEINGQGGATTRRSARLNEKAEKERCEGGVDIINSGTVSLTISTSSPNTRSRRSQLESTIEISEQQKFSFKPSFVNNGNNKLSGGITTTSTLLNHSLANCDSGTESSEDENDEELEMLDSLSNASRAALEEGIGRSPPTLTSSPPLISEIETSSWDSCGCESGIVLRDSAERDDASRNVDLLEAALGGGELVLDINGIKQINDEITGTTPIQSKGAFPAHFLSSSSSSSSIIRTCGSTGTLPLPIDFSALRQSEHLFSVSSDDTPTPIGSHKTSGQGAALMEMAIVENRTKTEEQSDAQHQGAFRRVLRRNRRNSNSHPITTSTSNVLAARTISPFGLGEKRRWGDQNVILNDNSSQESLIQQQQQPERSETPIAGRTRSMLMANALMLQNGSTNIDNSNNDRQVLTAARRTRVRILYSSSQHQQQQKGGGGGISSSIQTTTIQGRRGQVAPILGQSPPYMLANKRGRHCSNKSPPRPSLNFDKMRRRMLSSNNNNNMENLNENIREKNGGGTN